VICQGQRPGRAQQHMVKRKADHTDFIGSKRQLQRRGFRKWWRRWWKRWLEGMVDGMGEEEEMVEGVLERMREDEGGDVEIDDEGGGVGDG
jgi:hypothetical protein